LNKSDKKLRNSLERLASGKRINQAADDAAGLAISQKMKAQVRGTSQAQRNVQDGVSLLQVADEGLDNIMTPPLKTMRDLAVQAANDTYTDEDRKAMQDEFNQMKNSIDDIANNTEFNDIKLLMAGSKVKKISETEVNVTIKPGEQMVKAGEIEIPDPPNPSNLWVEADFSSVDDGSWPDLNIISPNGEHFGFQGEYLSGSNEQTNEDNSSSDKADYTGYGITPEDSIERFDFENPIPGKWSVYADNEGGSKNSSYNIKSNYPFDFKEINNEEFDGKSELVIQTGANSDDNFPIDLTNATTQNLGISSLSLETRENAAKAISIIDKAINQVSSERSKFGAYQNRLKHTSNNLSNYETNIEASNSRIEDVDMAKEMVNMSKQQILSQAGTAMLAQANNLPQGVLQLIN